MKPLLQELVVLDDPTPRSAAVNMAVDEILLRGVMTPVLRLYRWARPSLSFGYFTKWTEVLPIIGDREPVRRWTGGGIVFHGEDVTFTLIAPRTEPLGRMSAAESYRRVHAAVATALGAGELAAVAAPKVSAACFENPAECDVLIAGRKVVGGAQRRTADGFLHQGSVQWPGLAPGFGERLAHALALSCSSFSLPEEEMAAAEELARARYRTEKWLRRF